MSFQENLRYYREKAGYKQAKEFAKILNISYTTYTSYENQGREPKYNTLCKIADILQVSTDDLLGRTTNIIGNKDNEKDTQLEKIICDTIPYYNASNVGIMLHLNYINKDVICFDVGYSDDCLIGTGEINKEKFIKELSKIDITIMNTKTNKIFYYLADNVINDAIANIDKHLENFQKRDINKITFKNKDVSTLTAEENKQRIKEYQEWGQDLLNRKNKLLNLKHLFHTTNDNK